MCVLAYVTYQMKVLESELTSQTDMLNVRIMCLVTTGHYCNNNVFSYYRSLL